MQQNNKKARLQDIFQCTRCGYCCQGDTTVSLDLKDQERMVEELGGDLEMVKKTYWRVSGNIVQMKVIDHHCIFYDDKTGCSVHIGRPWRCGQWPLHPSILTDENNFHTIRESCPGINQEISYEEFCTLFKQLLAQDNQLIC